MEFSSVLWAATASVLAFLALFKNFSIHQRGRAVYIQAKNRLRKMFYKTTIPESVNYHFTRKCNYSCGFCFHTAKTSFLLPIDDAKHGLRMLADAGKCSNITFEYFITAW